MIPLPPPDPSLPALRDAFDPEAAAGLLGRALGVDLQTASPDWVKYRPGHSCIVRYRLGPAETMAHAVLAPERRAAKLWERGGAPASGRLLRQLGLIVLPYPADLRLPALAQAASPAGMLALLNRLPGHGRARACKPQLVRYKPQRRAVLRCELGEGPALYAKLRTEDRGRDILRAGRALRGLGISTPEPVAYLPRERMVVHAEAPGTRLRDLRGAGRRYGAWMEPAAEALAMLHDTPPVALAAWSPEQDAAELSTAADTAGALLPGLAVPARRLAERLAAGLAATRGAAACCHGSFHDDQVLVGGSGVVLLDLDSAVIADPLLDVGHFASYLSADGHETARAAFLDAYARRSGRGMGDALLFEAASLLRWSTLPFRELNPEWPALVERRLLLAERRLAEHRRSAGAVATPV